MDLFLRLEHLLCSTSFPAGFSPTLVPKACGSIQAENYFSKKWKPFACQYEDLIETTIEGLLQCGLVTKRSEIIHKSIIHAPFANIIFDHDRPRSLDVVHGYLDEIASPIAVGMVTGVTFGQIKHLLAANVQRVWYYGNLRSAATPGAHRSRSTPGRRQGHGYQRCPAAVDAPVLDPTSAFGVLAGAHQQQGLSGLPVKFEFRSARGSTLTFTESLTLWSAASSSWPA